MNDDLSSYIDHSFLLPTAGRGDILQLCDDAVSYGFASVCVPPCYVSLASEKLSGSKSKVCTVVGFPFGYCDTRSKLLQAELAVSAGADELDMVINQCAVKNGDYGYVLEEIKSIKSAFHDTVLKVIVETCNLNQREKERIVETVIESKADFIKTSTGFASAGAVLDDVIFFKSVVGEMLKIKASGGIKDKATARAFIEAGASRIGTSCGVAIVIG